MVSRLDMTRAESFIKLAVDKQHFPIYVAFSLL